MGWSVPVTLATGLATVAVDALTKRVVTASTPSAGILWRGIGIRVVDNRRGNLLGLSPRIQGWVLAAAVATTSVALWLSSGHGPAMFAGLGFVIGGAAANLADRIRHGFVVDYVVVGRWPAFNLADVALVAGTGLVALGLAT